MNRQLLDILNQQEQTEQTAYQSEALLLGMIRQDFVDSERLLYLLDMFGVGVVQLFQFPNFPTLIRETVMPVRTGNTFSIHKHTLCQIPYFHTHDFYELVYIFRGNCTQEFGHLPAPPSASGKASVFIASRNRSFYVQMQQFRFDFEVYDTSISICQDSRHYNGKQVDKGCPGVSSPYSAS